MREIIADIRPARPQDFGIQQQVAVYNIFRAQQRARDLHREGMHRALIIALHTDSLWERAEWK